MKYFLATHMDCAVVVANERAVSIRALAAEEISARGYYPFEASALKIEPVRGMTAAKLGERWFGYLEHFESEVRYVVSEAHHDFDIDDPSISRMTPPKFRRYLGQDPDAHFKAPFADYWKPLMHLLDRRPADRLEFNRAFDRLTSPMLNAYAAAMMRYRVSELLQDYPPDEVIKTLTAAYYVSEATARDAVDRAIP